MSNVKSKCHMYTVAYTRTIVLVRDVSRVDYCRGSLMWLIKSRKYDQGSPMREGISYTGYTSLNA